MAVCPCCLEEPKPSLLSLGGRRLAGACGLCREEICAGCLRAVRLTPGELRRRRAEGQLTVPSVACASCLWELLSARGEAPDFDEPPGHRRRVAQVACGHPRLVRWMRACPDCGAEVGWQAPPDAPRCDACGAPSHDLFNACWACGESFEEQNDPALADDEALSHPCSHRGCQGRVAWPMRYCPWCAHPQRWPHARDEEVMACVACDAPLDPTWAFCIGCGAEAPLPERCAECDGALDEAAAAARCERCRHLFCDGCFGEYAVPAAREGDTGEEQLLCADCAQALGAEPLAEASEADPDGLAAADEQDDDAEEFDSAEEDEGESEFEEEEAGAEQDDDPDSDVDEPEPPAPPEPSAWEILGVPPGTPLPEVRKAYVALISQYHPDKVAQLGPKLQALALEETRKLNAAWSALRELL